MQAGRGQSRPRIVRPRILPAAAAAQALKGEQSLIQVGAWQMGRCYASRKNEAPLGTSAGLFPFRSISYAKPETLPALPAQQGPRLRLPNL